MFIFDTFLNSNFFSFWKFSYYIPTSSILISLFKLNTISLSLSKITKLSKSFFEKSFTTDNTNEYSSGMQKVTVSLYVESLAENSKFVEKTDETQRFNRFHNSLLNYDYKTGNYVGY